MPNWMRHPLVFLLIGVVLTVYGMGAEFPTWLRPYLPEWLSGNISKLLVVFAGLLLVTHAVMWRWIDGNTDHVIKRIDYVWYGGSLLAVTLAIADFEANHRVRLLEDLRDRIQASDARLGEWQLKAEQRQEALREDVLAVQQHVCERIQPAAFPSPFTDEIEKLCTTIRKAPAWPVLEHQVCAARPIVASDLTGNAGMEREPEVEQLLYASEATRILLCGRTGGLFGQPPEKAFYEFGDETAFVRESIRIVDDLETESVGFLHLPASAHVTASKASGGPRANVLMSFERAFGVRAWVAGLRPLFSTPGESDPTQMPGLFGNLVGTPRWLGVGKFPALAGDLQQFGIVDLRLGCGRAPVSWLQNAVAGVLTGLPILTQRKILMLPPDDELSGCAEKLRSVGPPSGTIRDLGSFAASLKSGRTFLAHVQNVVGEAVTAARSRSDAVSWWPFIVAGVIALRLCKTTAEVRAADRKR